MKIWGRRRSAALAMIIVSWFLPLDCGQATEYVDDTGVRWSLDLVLCTDSNGRCLSGTRDTDSQTPCGPADVFGSIAADSFSVSSFNSGVAGCQTTHWRGVWSNEVIGISGQWQDEDGNSGSFFLRLQPDGDQSGS
jgi:hypothetical protein